MADANWKRTSSPAPVDGVDVGSTNTASVDLDVNIIVFKWLWLELEMMSVAWGFGGRVMGINFLLPEFCPFLLVIDHETLKSVWITHFDYFFVGMRMPNRIRICLRGLYA